MRPLASVARGDRGPSPRSRPDFWPVLLANGVDLINTDDLDGAQRFLQAPREQPVKKLAR